MATVSETRVNKITTQLDRLVDWMLVNKPQNKTIRIFKEDYAWLRKRDPIITGRGFWVTPEKIMYRGFILLRTEA